MQTHGLPLTGRGFQAARLDTRTWLAPERGPQGVETASLKHRDQHQARQSFLACSAVKASSYEAPPASLPGVPPAGKPQPQAGCQLPPSSSPPKVLLRGIASQSEDRITKCIPAQSLQQQGCLIKNELHFHQHREIDSQGRTVIILFLKQKGVGGTQSHFGYQ